MTLVHTPRRKVNCVKRTRERTWCGNSFDREVYGYDRRRRATCDACFVALVAEREKAA